MPSEDPVYFLLKGPSLPPAKDANSMLGRIVKNYAQPLADFTPDDASPFNPRSINSTPLSNVARIVGASSSSALEGKLLSLANLDKSQSRADKDSLLSSEIRACELQNQGDVFQRLIRDDQVRRQVVDWTEPGGDPLYMIVGLLMWQDASITHSSSANKSTDAGISVPTGGFASAAIASQTGVPVAPETIGDASLRHAKGASTETNRSAESKESQIFAVQCRIVRRGKRNIFKRSAPVLENRGPRVEGSRSFAAPEMAPSVKEDDVRCDVADAIFEMDPDDVPWTDALEDLEDPPEVQIDEVKNAEVSMSFAYEI